jgi:hypothetical protein
MKTPVATSSERPDRSDLIQWPDLPAPTHPRRKRSPRRPMTPPHPPKDIWLQSIAAWQRQQPGRPEPSHRTSTPSHARHVRLARINVSNIAATLFTNILPAGRCSVDDNHPADTLELLISCDINPVAKARSTVNGKPRTRRFQPFPTCATAPPEILPVRQIHRNLRSRPQGLHVFRGPSCGSAL